MGPKIAKGCTARFRQVNAEIPHVHHDALEFADGSVVLVAKLLPGQIATILQLPIEQGAGTVSVIKDASKLATDTQLIS